ncbi:MAG TPA: helix-turn-helix transcriptional regulator [Gemmatimonadaceae bacterium]|nr:helix-turn-helix transcriptional regulator [Gemmatimonadaceae bacterium]
MTRVVVVAGSPVLRAGLEALLAASPAVMVVGTVDAPHAEDEAPSLSELVAPLAPDVVLWVPEQGAAGDWLAPLRGDDGAPDATPSRAAVVLLADGADARAAAAALRAGAHAVLPLEATAAEVAAAVEAAAAGLLALPPELAGQLLGRAPDGAPGPVAGAPALPPAPLTAREREVLALLAEGLPNKLIAPRLGITEHTVKAHVAAIYEKLHAGNRAEAVMAAARQGLVLL